MVPSLTELLVDLGLSENIVGLTKFCIHPKGFKRKKAIIGGTKFFRFETIDDLKPDLIIGNKEENYQEGIAALEEKYPVWMSDVNNLEDAYGMIKSIGKITGTALKADNIVEEIGSGMMQNFSKKGTAVYLIWNDPIMVAGEFTFIHHMLEKAGFTNMISTPRYPKIDLSDLKSINPEFVLLSSEPYPFQEKHVPKYQNALPKSKVRIVDGELFSWYGSRLLKTIPYFHSL